MRKILFSTVIIFGLMINVLAASNNILINNPVVSTLFMIKYKISTPEERSKMLNDLKALQIDPEKSKENYLKINTGEVIKDIVYKPTDADSLMLDIYQPISKAYEKNPVLIYVHGGAWTIGSRNSVQYDWKLINMLRESGVCVISIGYRLAKESVNFEEQVSDVRDSIKWVVKNSDKYNFDVSKIGLMGKSSGAHISLMAALFKEELQGDNQDLKEYEFNIKYIIDYFGPVDLYKLFTYDAFDKKNKNVFLRYFSEAYFNKVKNNTEIEDYLIKMSPFRYISEATPPIFIAHGTKDSLVNIQHSEILINELKKYNIEYNKIYVKDAEHIFGNASEDDLKKITEKTAAFIINKNK